MYFKVLQEKKKKDQKILQENWLQRISEFQTERISSKKSFWSGYGICLTT